MTFNLTINMDKQCAECRKPGATGSGICLTCATKAMDRKPMRSAQGQAVQRRWMEGCKASANAGGVSAKVRTGLTILT